MPELSDLVFDASFAVQGGFPGYLSARRNESRRRRVFLCASVLDQLRLWSDAHDIATARAGANAALKAIDGHGDWIVRLDAHGSLDGIAGDATDRGPYEGLDGLRADRWLGRKAVVVLTQLHGTELAIERKQQEIPLSARAPLYYCRFSGVNERPEYRESWFGPEKSPGLWTRLFRRGGPGPDPTRRFHDAATDAVPRADAVLVQTSGFVPEPGSRLRLDDGSRVRLGKPLKNPGAEGTIFRVEGRPDWVCKVFSPENRTTNRFLKLRAMLERSVPSHAICWPRRIVFAGRRREGNEVGYLMPFAGEGLDTLKRLLLLAGPFLERYPRWNRRHSVWLAVDLVELVERVHSLGAIIGDLNPQNLLFAPNDYLEDGSERLRLVDCDSLQLEDLPCTVGREEFTPASRQGLAYASYLRTQEDDLFALAVLLFMILMCGRHPYEHKGGTQPGANIAKGLFPYAIDGDPPTAGEKAPSASDRFAWTHLSEELQQLFVRAFRGREAVAAGGWMASLERYAAILAEPDRVFMSPIKNCYDLNVRPLYRFVRDDAESPDGH